MEDSKITIDDDGKLTEVAQQVFNIYDTDGSGFIDRSELRNALVSVAKEEGIAEPTDEDVRKIIAKLDTNNSGTLDFSEFKAFVKSLLQ